MKFDIVASLKEFFFDIIGFFVPGFISKIIIEKVFGISTGFLSEVYIMIIMSYVFGYVIHSFTLLKDNWFNTLSKKLPISSVNTILDDLSSKDNYKLVSKIIEKEIAEDEQKLSNYRSFRNYAMSAVPEADKKVYLFMFRAEVFNQLHTIVLISLLIGTVFNLSSFCIDSFNDYVVNWAILIVFFILAFTLRIGWKRFYAISMNIPFSIYLSKTKTKSNES